MRDIVILGFLIACIVMAIRVPWTGVLVLAIFSYLNPHRYAWGFMLNAPVFQILFIVVALVYITPRGRAQAYPIPKDWRIPAFYTLWFYYLITTLDSEVPSAAWARLLEVSKIYLPLIFTLLYINSRERLYFLVATIAGAFVVTAGKGGLFALATGFQHRVYGPLGTQFYDNNIFALAVIMNIPLLVLLYRENRFPWAKPLIAVAIPLFYSAALSSWSRGALLALSVTTLALIWHSKRKYLMGPLLVIGVLVVLPMLPDEWFARMHTIDTYQTDSSANERLEAWGDGWRYALRNPLTGAGFDGWIWVTQRDWHSSYVEMFSEHGFVGFGLWASLLFGTMFNLTRLLKQVRPYEELRWVTNYASMFRASLAAYSVGAVFLGLSYWDLFYHVIFMAVILRKLANEELARLPEPSPKTALGFGPAGTPGNALAQRSPPT